MILSFTSSSYSNMKQFAKWGIIMTFENPNSCFKFLPQVTNDDVFFT